MLHATLKTVFGAIALACFVQMLAPALASAQVSGDAFSGFSSNSKDPIQIEADELEVIDSESRAIYRGNVKIRQGASVITTSQLDVKYSRAGAGGQGDIERLDLSGGVVATSKTNTASANRGTYIVKTEDIILDGKVVVSQGKNVATGCRLEANLRTNIANLKACKGTRKKGRVKTILTPGSRPKN